MRDRGRIFFFKRGELEKNESRERKRGFLFQSAVDFRGLQRQSISNADMIQRFPVQLPMDTQLL